MSEEFLKQLNLPDSLANRILCRVPPPAACDETNNVEESSSSSSSSSSSQNNKSSSLFVLYLPTVVLRKQHNPGFALACRIANHYQVPLVVLCTVLDDHHLTRTPHKPICMTARRLAFTLEALQSCTKEWQDHGAGVAIRIHGPGARIPHHLTLAHQAALAVVSDEPFVEPFRTYLRKVVGSCQTAKVPCFTVDGSTTVPPKSKLRRLAREQSSTSVAGDLCFQGAPAKAWIWEKQTNPHRKAQVHGTVKNGDLDAPPLQKRVPPQFFLHDSSTEDDVITRLLLAAMPSKWRIRETPSPGTRPWTVEELSEIKDVKHWSMTSWPGADTTVPPCRQTHGSQSAAKQRWKAFVHHGLPHYAKRRNQIVLPHAVSRISCYLNLGILSIMEVVSDVWQAQTTKSGYSVGCQKFLDEVIKWREIGYVHTFAMPGYHTLHAIPQWSQDYLRKQQQQQQQSSSSGIRTGYTYEQLDSCTTSDETWNAMQSYLVETGELHNNARMTWGKTVLHWQAKIVPPEDCLWQLVVLNDRYALDGLSPPSYAGLLWCFGWCDKPGSGGSVSTKWAHRYRQGPESFEQAKERLYTSILATPSAEAATTASSLSSNPQKAPDDEHSHSTPAKKARRGSVGGESSSASSSKKKSNHSSDSTKSILSYFAPVGTAPSSFTQ